MQNIYLQTLFKYMKYLFKYLENNIFLGKM